MKILHLSNTPLSNAPANLAQIQRDAGYEAQVLLHRQTNTNKVFVGGNVWCQMGSEEISECVKSADIIHFHNFAWEQEIFRQYPDLIPVCKRKPCLIQYHSPRHSVESFEATLKDPFFDNRRAVVAQYQVRFYPEAEHIVPNVIPIWDKRFTPLATKISNHPPRVSFAPSNVNLKGWDDKGVAAMRQLFFKLERAGIIQSDIITNTPYEEMLIRKKWADIGFEEIVTGSYHLSFLEYMSFGLATFCSMDSKTESAMEAAVGKDAMHESPWLQVVPERAESTLVELLRSPEEIASRGKRARKWMETHWNPTTFVRHFERIYAQL
jgi:hypothetical protein